MTARVEDALRMRLIEASAALAARADAALGATLMILGREAAGRADVAIAVEEMLLQSYLFLGYPLALEGLRRWRSACGAAPAATPDDWDAWIARGAEVCATVYGGQYDELRANVRALHPDVERWMVTEGYGKVLGRPGLHLMDRELCIVALLVVLDTPRQLYSHLRGALNAGATETDVVGALRLAEGFAEPAARKHASETWERLRAHRSADPTTRRARAAGDPGFRRKDIEA